MLCPLLRLVCVLHGWLALSARTDAISTMAVEKLDLSALFVRSREIGLDHAVVSECLSSPDPKSLLQKEIVDAMHHAASDKQSDGSATEVRLELAEAHLDSMDDKMQKQGSQLTWSHAFRFMHDACFIKNVLSLMSQLY